MAAIVRRMEPDFGLVECLRPGNCCQITQSYLLISPIQRTMAAFVAVLEGYSLADLALQPEAFGLQR